MTEILKKPFKLDDLFYCISKTSIVPNFMKSDVYTDETTILAISSATTNNMLKYYVNEKEHNLLENCISVAYTGNAGVACYQKNKFAIAQNSYVLKLKNTENENKEVYLYLLAYLKKLTQKFSYTNLAVWNRYKEEIVNLPVKSLEDTEPDYEYMEKYMEKVKSDYIDSVINENNSKIEELKTYLENNPEIDITKNPLKKEFKIGDLFNITNGGRVTKDNQVKGDIPYVTASTENNGIDSFIANPLFTQSYILTVNFFGNVFWHPYTVSFKDGTFGLKLKERKYSNINLTNLYLKTIIEKITINKGSYSKMLTGNILKEILINLPVKKLENTEPDYAYMEKYMANLEYNYRLNLNKVFYQ